MNRRDTRARPPGLARLGHALGAGAVAVVTAVAGLTAVTLGTERPAAAQTLLSETFKDGATPTGAWTAPSPKGSHQPCLTAAAKQPPKGSLTWCDDVSEKRTRADATGAGAFQLTDNSRDDAGGLILNQALSADAGLHIQFDQFQYNTSTRRGADGIAFFLIDGAAKTGTIGEIGGGLGYRKLPGAVIGVGFDEFGNFSNPEEWSTGDHKDKGPEPRPNSVVVRGAESTGYQYVKGVEAPRAIASDSSTTREKARRTVTVDISTANVMSVFMDFHDGAGKRELLSRMALDRLPGQPPLPETLKLGFAASTGYSTAYHEIQNFTVQTLDPDLTTTVTPEGPFRAGGTGTFDIDVADKPEAGPTTGPTTTTFVVPDGLTPKLASGNGWDCAIKGQKVTCTTPTKVRPGGKLPPVKVVVGIPADAPPKVSAQSQVDTPDEAQPRDNTSPPVTVPIAPLPPDVSIDVRPDGPFQAGGTGSVTATVSNAQEAGPSTGPVTVTLPAPEGTTVTGAAGPGWECAIAADKGSATCRRTDPLAPGEAFPPVKATYTVPPTVAGELTVPAKVGTPGDADPANDKATAVAEVLPAPPDLSVSIAGGPISAGGTGQVAVTVANGANAGPTEDEVKVTVPPPAGAAITAAAGPGWKCGVVDGEAVCTRPGTGKDVLDAGEEYPPITVALAATPIVLSGKVATKGDTHTRDNSTQTMLAGRNTSG